MAKSVNREEAFNITGMKMGDIFKKDGIDVGNKEETEKTVEKKEADGGKTKVSESETKVRKSNTTPKKQADNSETRRVTCYLPTEMYKEVRKECIDNDCSITYYIISAIEEHMNTEKKQTQE